MFEWLSKEKWEHFKNTKVWKWSICARVPRSTGRFSFWPFHPSLTTHQSISSLIFYPQCFSLIASLHHHHPPPPTSLPGRSLLFVVSRRSHFQPESLPPLLPPSWREPPLPPAPPPLSAAAPQPSSPALRDSSCGHSDSSPCKTPWGADTCDLTLMLSKRKVRPSRAAFSLSHLSLNGWLWMSLLFVYV